MKRRFNRISNPRRKLSEISKDIDSLRVKKLNNFSLSTVTIITLSEMNQIFHRVKSPIIVCPREREAITLKLIKRKCAIIVNIHNPFYLRRMIDEFFINDVRYLIQENSIGDVRYRIIDNSIHILSLKERSIQNL